MINIYRSISETDSTLEEIPQIEPGCWINMVSPKEQEIIFISKKTGVSIEFLKAALDDEETSRIEHDGDVTLIIEDFPFTETEENSLSYDTYPLAIIHSTLCLITVCLKNSKVLQDFHNGRIRTFYTFKKSRFILQILQRISAYFLLYLRQIDKKSSLIEKQVYRSVKNRELIHMLSLEKSLVYFTTSLKSNQVTLEKMLKLDMMKKYPEDEELLADVIIETRQAIEMAGIYSDVLSRILDIFANVINMNLNHVMKYLTTVTILITIPNLVTGFMGMNVPGLPLENHRHGGIIYFVIIMVITLVTAYYLKKRDMF